MPRLEASQNWLTATLLIAWTSYAEAQGSPEDRKACTPDVFRLCSDFIPDPTSIEACLRRRSAELSLDCKNVLLKAKTSTPSDAGRRSR